jgi:TolB protein
VRAAPAGARATQEGDLGKRLAFAVLLVAVAAGAAEAQRKPVLPQIDLPHPYYYREMYLPQLTSGPSAVTWSPDSMEVIYSMAGSLWRQRIDSTSAQQLTDGPGYDYQPDWSPDGRSVVYCSYQKDAMELWLLELASGRTQQLTSGGAVNVEPRWSPDGKRIAFVSTAYNKRFHIFVGDVREGRLENAMRLTGETRSPLPRYYYSAYDHEISPVWSPDGEEILFVSNRGHMYGTGGFWRMKAQPAAAGRPGAEAREIHYEETTWKARPDFSPDGTRIVYSSYLGRQWHQLWVMPANGGDAFPVSYGEWDETSVRWSRDGKQLAFISNRNGNTELWLESMPGGNQRQVRIQERTYVRPKGRLRVRVLDESGKPTAARVSVTDAAGRFYAPVNSWIHADDGFDRAQRPFEAYYFHTQGEADVPAPAGRVQLEVMKGFECRVERREIEMRTGEVTRVEVRLKPFAIPHAEGERWVSGDLHVHMNYGGVYRNTPAHLVEQAEAENLSVVNNLIVNKEQRIPDVAYAGRGLDPASRAETLVVHGQEFHTSYWGHLGLLGIRNLLLPDYAGYPNTAATSLVPTNATVADLAHAQGALVGYVHPFSEEPQPLASPSETITHTLPVDVALGKVDYLEVVGFSDHRATAAVWYRLLNLGFRIPAGAGTDATTNYAAPIRGNVGFDRVYVRAPQGPLNLDEWMNGLKKGRTFVTNAPLVEFTLGGEMVGGELKMERGKDQVAFTAKLRSIVPVNHLEIVCNGKVGKSLELSAGRDAADVTGTLPLRESGWCVLRAWSDKAEYPVPDNYVYATTSPIYVTIGGKPPRSPEDAAYFAAWIDRIKEATERYLDWNSPAEKEAVRKELAEARAVYEKLRRP